MKNVGTASSGMIWTDDLASMARRMSPAVSEVRRHLHQYPELSMQEYATTRYLVERLASLGLEARVTPVGIGAVCDWQSDGWHDNLQPVGLRGDIDALPIMSETTKSYGSKSPGIMHACGHDAHAAMVWGALAILKFMAEEQVLPWPVAVRGIFQPAEETSEGGQLMIESGALEALRCVLALHVDPTLEVGKVAGRAGAFTAACDTFDVAVQGRGGHSARPHLCIDALAAAASWICELYSRLPRVHDCRDPAVVSVGAIHSGNAPNVVAGEAVMSGTIRSFSESARAAIMQEMRNLAEATERSDGCTVQLAFSAYTPSLHNDKELQTIMAHAASKLRDIEQVGTIELPSMGAEDFAFFAQHRPVCMMRLGVAGPALGMHALHTPNFDIDERALMIGAQLLAASVIDLCHPTPR
jgi:amidohydrolase